jgi:dTDP-4-amino-4,6-dideoxygalactose transaminase
MGRRLQRAPADCPVTESVSARLLRLPFFPTLTEEEQARIIGAITAWSVPA